MIERLKIYGRPEGCIYEQFAYLPDIIGYLNSSDMNGLAEIPHTALWIFKDMEKSYQGDEENG